MLPLNHTGNPMTPAKAESIADNLNSMESDDWTYRAKHDPKGTGLSLVEVYDENGEFTGYL